MDYHNVICFHNPDEENGYLSNWYMAEFIYDNIKFSSMEQYMMYQKSITFNDYEVADEILKTDDVAQIKALGRKVHNYSDEVWNGIRQIIVYNGLLEKFKQNLELLQKLLDTKDALIMECAVKDTIWGIGLGMKDSKRFCITDWKGKNLLGFTLMEVRKTLSMAQKWHNVADDM